MKVKIRNHEDSHCQVVKGFFLSFLCFGLSAPLAFSSNCFGKKMCYKYVIVGKVTLEDIVEIKEVASSRIVLGPAITM